MTNSDNKSIWPTLFVCLIAGVFVQTLFGGCDSGTSSNNTSGPVSVDRNSFEHRYAKERIKLEGYSDREASQAADAIIKFHNAQQNR